MTLQSKGLGRLTAHSYCLRIIDYRGAHVAVTEQIKRWKKPILLRMIHGFRCQLADAAVVPK